jgi:hypothetical protein
MTEQAEATPATPAAPVPEQKMNTVVGKELSLLKRQLLGRLQQNYSALINVLCQIPGDQDLKQEAVELFDRGFFRFQEAVVALRVLNVPQPEAPKAEAEAPQTENPQETPAQEPTAEVVEPQPVSEAAPVVDSEPELDAA